MTGPENYQEGETFLAGALELIRVNSAELSPYQWITLKVQMAQVHATLALAAATAIGAQSLDRRHAGMPIEDFHEWDQVAGVPMEDTDGD